MNINSKATSAIVDSLFRLVRDGSAMRGPAGAKHRGAAGATGKLTALYATDRSVCLALMHLKQVCCAALVNRNVRRIVT